MEVSYKNLVGPRREKIESIEPFWSFPLFTSKWEVHMSFPRELCTYGGCIKGGNMDTMLLGRHYCNYIEIRKVCCCQKANEIYNAMEIHHENIP
jgi:hypothetical protein